MKNFLICFRNDNLEVTHKIYVRAKNNQNIIKVAKDYLGLEKSYGYDYMDYGQSRKLNIPLIII